MKYDGRTNLCINYLIESKFAILYNVINIDCTKKFVKDKLKKIKKYFI